MLEIISTCPRTNTNSFELEELCKKFNYKYIEIFPENQGFNSSEMKNILSDTEICIVGDDEVNKDVLIQCKKLKHIIKWGTGTDNIDLNYANENNIKVHNTPNILGKYVAEYTLGLIIDNLRNISNNNSNMKNKIWDKSSGISLYEKIIGLYGFGDIGRNLAKLVRPFGCEVIYTDLKNMSQNDAEYVQFDQLIEKSQILIISAPLTEDTYKVINKQNLEKNNSLELLVNISRGGLVDENEIFDLVLSQNIKRLSLDVYENEPPLIKDSILNNEKFLFTSHNASNTIDANYEINLQILHILQDILGE
tara:strand:+ start:985 stop:1905 length:921 start_codon:yes stop_codon:yes gene_type:complete